MKSTLARRVDAEFIGTLLLLAAVVGSGIMVGKTRRLLLRGSTIRTTERQLTRPCLRLTWDMPALFQLRVQTIPTTRSHRFRNPFNSDGGRSQISAAVSRHWRRTSTLKPWRPTRCTARNAASSVRSSPKYATGAPRSASERIAVTAPPLSRPTRNSSPASNSSKPSPSI